MAWVDLWCGILVCNVLLVSSTTLPLPPPLKAEDIAVVHGYIKYVEIQSCISDVFLKKEHVLILAHYIGPFRNRIRKKRKITKKFMSHPDLRANPNARIHVRQDQVTHMHRLSEYQKHSVNRKESIKHLLHD
jgi:hypothetical protein